MILAGVAGLVVIIIVIAILKIKESPKATCGTYPNITCGTYPNITCGSCPTCPFTVTRKEVMDLFNLTYDKMPPPTGMSKEQIISVINSQNLILPQDVQSMTPSEVAKLSALQLAALSLANIVLMSKIGFSVPQLQALTPAQISTLDPTQVMSASFELSSNKFTPDQLEALKKVLNS